MEQPSKHQAFVSSRLWSRGGGRVSDGFQDHYLSCWKGWGGVEEDHPGEPSKEVGQLWLSDPPGDNGERWELGVHLLVSSIPSCGSSSSRGLTPLRAEVALFVKME